MGAGSREVAEKIKEAKSDFDNMDRKLMRDAVQRANPWELVSTKSLSPPPQTPNPECEIRRPGSPERADPSRLAHARAGSLLE